MMEIQIKVTMQYLFTFTKQLESRSNINSNVENRKPREVGGGIGMGNTCKFMAVSFQCMTKSTTNFKN